MKVRGHYTETNNWSDVIDLKLRDLCRSPEYEDQTRLVLSVGVHNLLQTFEPRIEQIYRSSARLCQTRATLT
jgi:hypothetical protein